MRPFFISLCSIFVLAALGSFTFNQNNEVVKVHAVHKWVDSTVCGPIRTCMAEISPDLFMTKCYADVEFSFNADWLNNNLNAEIAVSNAYEGWINFNNCEVNNHIAEIKVHYSSKEIWMRESLMSDWQTHENFIKHACKKIGEIGIAE